ncbi:hypothetical protein [Psychroserpens jangbogonensis]|uniref:hypothetical protein n=1 Tax=Psychroserpens jangbogonensis TaxID=1484460 RepID=UPI000B1D45DD|nr:hypothetical protein [Psychroserpens jangbogonensis]
MELKNYSKTKSQFLILLGLSFILASCSSTRDFNSKNAITDIGQESDYQNYFNDKVNEYETSNYYDNLYFTDLITNRANYFSGRSLFGQYQYTGRGNRFNNVTINNIGINIYSDFAINNLGRTNWAWTSNHLESWGWINKGWNTPWNQNNWRSVSNSWNGPIWNYWGWDGDPENSLCGGDNSWSRGLRFPEFIKKRHSVYQQFASNSKIVSNQYSALMRATVIKTKKTSIRYASLTKRTNSDSPRSRPKSKTVRTSNTSLSSNQHISSNSSSTRSKSRSNSKSTVRKSSNNSSITRSSSSSSNTLSRKSTKN